MALFLKWVSLRPMIKICSAAASSRLPSLAVAPGFASPAAWPHPAHDSGHERCSRNGFGRLIRSLSSLHHRRPLIRDGPLLAESVTALQLTGKTCPCFRSAQHRQGWRHMDHFPNGPGSASVQRSRPAAPRHPPGRRLWQSHPHRHTCGPATPCSIARWMSLVT